MSDVNLENLDLVIADSSTHMRKLVRAMLTGFGVGRIYEAADGAAALELVEGQMPHILICDIKMPIIDGIELMQMIRNPRASKNPYLPIIVATSQSQKKIVLKIRDAGATEILCKPFSISALYARIQNIILKPRKFIECDSYFGPDRRRKVDATYAGPFRRQDDAMALELKSLMSSAEAS